MEKRTLLAVVLSVIVVIVMFGLNNLLFPPEEFEPIPPVEEPEAEREAPDVEDPDVAPDVTEADRDAERLEADPSNIVAVPLDEDIDTEPIVYESDTLRVVMDPVGAVVRSIELLNHYDGDQPVNMVLAGESEGRAFEMRFGGVDGQLVDEPFRLEREAENIFVFSREFHVQGREDEPFEVRKRFRFEPGEYLIQFDVELVHSVNEYIPLDFNGRAYTISYGPQIGPDFDSLDGRHEFRRFETLKQERGLDRNRYDGVEEGQVQIIEDRVLWAAIAGKYFATIGVTDATRYRITFASEPVPGLLRGNQMHFTRPLVRSSRNTDTFRFYTGPKTDSVLTRYNSSADNAFGVSGLSLDEAQDIRPIIGWLENIMEWGLKLFYRIVPNYGIAIILLTIVVKGALYPLTRKSFTSMRRMQELQPKINELREKYKNDQQKMNQAMAEFYKKEKVNPLGGCLPMLLQIPFFIAMFGVFNNSFDLRGATFIPGWIDDLSATESIFSWGGFGLPVIGNDIRLLPIIFLVTQLFTSKFMQSGATSGSSTQQKLMKYALPAFIFFVLYNMPAGLLVYMILTNLVTGIQQYLASRGAPAST